MVRPLVDPPLPKYVPTVPFVESALPFTEEEITFPSLSVFTVNSTLPPLPEVKLPPLVLMSALIRTAPTPLPSISEFRTTLSLPAVEVMDLLTVTLLCASSVKVVSLFFAPLFWISESTVIVAALFLSTDWILTLVPLLSRALTILLSIQVFLLASAVCTSSYVYVPSEEVLPVVLAS